MALNTIINNVCKDIHNGLKTNAPIILTVVGCIGLAGTVAVTIRQAPKAKAALDDLKEEKAELGEETTVTDVVKTVGKYYIPVVAAGTATAACFIASTAIGKCREADLASAFAAAVTYHNEYRNTLIELKGKEVDDEVISHMDLARYRCDFHALDMTTPDKKMIFVDSISGQEIECYERDIMDAEYHFNRNYILRGYSRVNDWYDMAGFNHTNEGDYEGWSMDSGLMWVDFEHIPTDDGKKVMIHYTWGPSEDDLEGFF